MIPIWRLLLLFLFATVFVCPEPLLQQPAAPSAVQLLSSSSPTLQLVSGLTARFQCSTYRCGPKLNSPTICWYKDDILLFNGTQFEPTSGVEPSRIILQRSVEQDSEENGAGGQSCVGEEFTLLLRNLSREDSGKYSCQLWGSAQQLDFNLDVIDSGLRLNFSERLTYDHQECCLERGVSPLCRPMCRPRVIGDEFFDPTSCGTEDYRNFLHCATDGGRRNYVPCCTQKSIPAFCYEFCSNDFQSLKKSHRLCLYYLPDIFDCFSRQFALNPPSAPTQLVLKEFGQKNRKLCWKAADEPEAADDSFPMAFEVHLRQMPEMPPVLMLETQNPQQTQKPLRLTTMGTGSRRRKRSAAESGVRKTSRKISVSLVEETRKNQQEVIRRIQGRNIEWGPDSSEICIAIGGSLLRRENGGGWLIYVQAINEHGSSEPSRPIFVTDDGQVHLA